jgi:arsenite methyltransferase
MSDESVRDLVKEKYGQAALRVASGGTSCCGSTTSQSGCDPVTSNLYETAETADLPPEAVVASLGCGNPTALAELKPAETVLDLAGRAVASTSYSPPGESARQARPTDWT